MKRKSEVDRWASLARWGVSAAVFLAGCAVLPDNCGEWVNASVFLVAIAVFGLLKHKAQQEQQRRIETRDWQ
jgi:hypothetical protein